MNIRALFSRFKGRSPYLIAAVTIALLLAVSAAFAVVLAVVDINPSSSDLDATDPNGASSGRINGLASEPGNNQVFYAASEWGGLFKSTDGGLTWFRLDSHIPVVAWDVMVDPANVSRVYATSFFDGRVNPRSGIQVSTNGGIAWTRPASAQPNSAAQEGGASDNTPQAGFICAEQDRTEPSAFGIGIHPFSTNVYIGTNCGVAISNDSGLTWSFFDPTPLTPADKVWDVVVQAGGVNGTVDICGDDGHLRSTDGGATWTAGGALPSGRCSIAVSPDESYVLFVVASDNNVYESDDAGATWTNLGSRAAQGRIPFVVTNQRSDSGGNNRFDLWYDDTQLFLANCITPNPPAQGGAARCPASAAWSNQNTGSHWDGGDLEFDSQVSVDSCPMLLSNDGGVYYQSAGCQTPTWEQPNVTPHALWIFSMDGANQAGNASEDLGFGCQDTGTFASTDAGAGSPTWSNKDCCDTFNVVADSNRVVYTNGWWSPGRGIRMFVCNPGIVGCAEVNTYPSAGNLQGFRPINIIDTFGDRQYVVVDANGVWFTNDITAAPIVWTQLGAATDPANACGVRASVTGGTPTFYVQAGDCNGGSQDNTADQLWAFTGTGAGSWTRLDTNLASGGIGVFGVDPTNPNRLYASNLRTIANGGPQMVFSTDGGVTWTNDPELDTLMTGGGVFKYRNERGPTSFTGFNGYSQPSLVAYDPEDPNILIAGGRDAGIFLSNDGGANWSLVTDPFNGNPHIPRPWFAYFDHEPAGTVNAYLGTAGRGVWRLSFQLPTANAGGPYNTPEGTDVALDGTASLGPGGALSYAWDFDNDGAYDDAVGATPTFNLVGQDGVFPVGLKVTDPTGASDVDSTTVTVSNVAPAVNLGSDSPVPEGTPVHVNGTVSDPGWLENLTATIDWADGTPIQPIVGVLENTRPDATFTFNLSHLYAADGLYNAQVCGYDDDTNTCSNILLDILPQADLKLTKTAAPQALLAGSPLVFTLTVENLGPSDAANATITDPLPAGLTYNSASAGCAEAAGVVTCNLGNVAVGAVVTVQINVTVNLGVSGMLINQATVASPTGDPNPANNTAQAPISILSTMLFYNLQDNPGPEWSDPTLTTSPCGTTFLGEFSSQTVTLNLTGIPFHTRVMVLFDLYVLRAWTGNEEVGPRDYIIGPDIWWLWADNNELLRTTFSNWLIPPLGQSYPKWYPGGLQAPQEGAKRVFDLCYEFEKIPMDATYEMMFEFDHTANTLQVDFTAFLENGLNIQSWGLDNVMVLLSSGAPFSPYWRWVPFVMR